MSGLIKIGNSLQKSGLQYRSIANNYWQIPMINDNASYILHVKLEGGWVCYAADLVGVSQRSDPKSKQKFFEYALNLNCELNGPTLAIGQGRIILMRNEQAHRLPADDDNDHLVALRNDINLFNKTHQSVFEQLLRKAQELQVKLEHF